MEHDRSLEITLYHLALIEQAYIGDHRIATSPAGNRRLRTELERAGGIDVLYEELLGVASPGVFLSPTQCERICKASFTYDALTILDEGFPPQLAKAKGASPIIYVRRGEQFPTLDDLTAPSIAAVGTRRTGDVPPSTLNQARTVLERYIERGGIIISGLATGCDTLAHDAAIANQGRTIAVLGTPLDRTYPKENADLQALISQHHALISPYPVGMKTWRQHFANRNTTTAGLASDGLFVIASPERSGTQHAIKAAYLMGRPIYTLPHNRRFEWTRRYNATIIEDNLP